MNKKLRKIASKLKLKFKLSDNWNLKLGFASDLRKKHDNRKF